MTLSVVHNCLYCIWITTHIYYSELRTRSEQLPQNSPVPHVPKVEVKSSLFEKPKTNRLSIGLFINDCYIVKTAYINKVYNFKHFNIQKYPVLYPLLLHSQYKPFIQQRFSVTTYEYLWEDLTFVVLPLKYGRFFSHNI